ncbi:MFS general substrate transporter [Viridothelium virens]|uniref:MFS general substrate transporter n=1 Tax=Viridothelium virens TaxID=1048519 RepID=A0A6A6HNB3_VIRVR|nr:MFS general substrate transporter [Viridothelium virens]
MTLDIGHQSTTAIANLGNSDHVEKDRPVTWMSLPRKDQLLILTLARLSEPLTQTGLQAYMFYQLKSFNPSSPDATISAQAGAMQASFTAMQFVTAMMWGRVSDSSWGGRKRVIVVGLLGTCMSVLGFGFSGSFAQAVFFRCLGGFLNGNVGVMRTMISEIIKGKKYQSRAFLLLPMTFNIGSIIGPILSGLLADPIASYPHIFGPDSILGGTQGVRWMTKFPYALPNIVSAGFLLCSALGVILGLEETLEARRNRSDWGLKLGRSLGRLLSCRRRQHQYTPLAGDEPISPTSPDTELQNSSQPSKPPPPRRRQKLPFRRIWTRNVCLTFLAYFLLASHVGTFNNLWFIFLSTPRYDAAHPSSSLKLPSSYHPTPPLRFTGGLGLPPSRIGLALALLGTIGITLQLLLYPRASTHLGTQRSYRLSLALFPLAYVLAPFLALLPSSTPPPAPVAGVVVWLGIAAVLCVQVLARTFALPASAILVNNCAPHPSVLGTVHGLGQSVSSAARTVGPLVAGWGYGRGLEAGVVGAAWWVLAGVATVGFVAGGWVREGNGHEILLEGEGEDEEEGERDGGERQGGRK